MHQALETFLKEYQIWLKATEEKYEITKEKFVEIQEQIKTTGVTDDLLSSLFMLSHNLFQTNYLLMESHMRVNNIRSNYSEENQAIIDQYDTVAKKANKLLNNIDSYKASLETASNSDLTI